MDAKMLEGKVAIITGAWDSCVFCNTDRICKWNLILLDLKKYFETAASA